MEQPVRYQDFTIAELKGKLRQLELSVAGNKAELIARLMEVDPAGAWAQDLARHREATGDDGAVGGGEQVSPRDREAALVQKEVELERRERENAWCENWRVLVVSWSSCDNFTR